MKYLSEAQEKKLAVAGAVQKRYFSQVAAELETSHDPSLINDYSDAVAVWKPDGEYERNDVRKDPEDGYPYWALHTHRATDHGNVLPHNDVNLWRICHGTSIESARPFMEDAANLYYKGHYCTHNDVVWKYISDTPSAYAPDVVPAYWEQVQE